mmetsp:Transcript_65286/g.76696  ORF Transcript_65286/g.76696 Transcript_65286/m.76696 type:complete len:317 (+) Transcript_65286:57-1007(+)|eukprot:CAMPEP_0194354112 /NCGR_PEP_ID=MMETSP0174-20130528/2301_1 /TAXON_ID=216777 /ORGANISM="Proboscia alata, Strain PI-D3" /LENGTH=316 /DNA_ID=CAMNT_0039122905 /DNA_START=57 /DNA_END=1007 /DNA_ORIENTATION=+
MSLSLVPLVTLIVILFTFTPYLSEAFTSTRSRRAFQTHRTSQLWSTIKYPPSQEATQLKNNLLDSLTNFRVAQENYGGAPEIDFGVRGGELNETSRAPQKVDYYAISPEVGAAADEVLRVCAELRLVSPIDEPTQFLGSKVNGTRAPLNGPWKLLFTTAADASFSKNSTRGDAKAQNVVDAVKGKITNVIDFATRDDGTEPVLKQLNVVIKATANSPTRVALNFLYAKAVLTKFFFFPLFGRKLVLYIPVPAAFITRIIVFFTRLFRFGKTGAKTVPKAYFDVLYLDDELRVHKTGEDNIFVQGKPTWAAASRFFE